MDEQSRIPPKMVREFLVALANLPDDPAAVDRFLLRYQSLSPKPSDHFRTWLCPALPQDQQLKRWISSLKGAVRSIWRASDIRTKQFGVFRVLETLFRPIESYAWPLYEAPEEVRLPLPTTFDQVLLYLVENADRTRYCGNLDCQKPYFFAVRRSQKYCSEKCSKPAQQEFKRRWWAEHGDVWRKRRAARHTDKQ